MAPLDFAGSADRRRRIGRLVADIVKYGFASAAALVVDYAVLVGGVALGFDYHAAAAIGFCLGLATVYATSVRFVFAGRRRSSRRREIIVFLVSGLAGLLLTEALMQAFHGGLGLPVALAKIPTAGFVFLFNFLARRTLFAGDER